MGNRNFHTALVGGFRKKDVVNFLAEDKRQQEAVLKDLQTQLDEAVKQIGDLMAERDSAQETVQELRQQQEELQEKLDEAREELVEQRQFTEQIRLQGEAELVEMMQQRDEAMSRATQLECDLESADTRNAHLEAKVQEIKLANRFGLDMPGEPEGTGALAKELNDLRQQLQSERQRAEVLAAKVNQTRQPAEGMDQLWNLCGKMERTLQQMERLLDGPYRMTCYPEPMEIRQEERQKEPVCTYVPAEPAEERFVPAEDSTTVKSLLQRIRGKR